MHIIAYEFKGKSEIFRVSCILKSYRFPAWFFSTFRVELFHRKFRVLIRSSTPSHFPTCENNSRYNHRGERNRMLLRTLGKVIHCQPPETPTMRFRRLAENFSRVGSLYLPIRRLGTVRFNVLNIRYRVAAQIKQCQLPVPITAPPSAERAGSRGRENHL